MNDDDLCKDPECRHRRKEHELGMCHHETNAGYCLCLEFVE